MTSKYHQIKIDGDTYELVPSSALRIGDKVNAYGCLMELRTRNERPDTVNNNASGNVVWCRGYPLDGDLGSIPASWLSPDEDGGRYWSIQGNDLATWPRLIEEDDKPIRFRLSHGPDGDVRLHRT
ncbi:hypothetical protein MHM88_11350 [Epibacterium sp. MM17-32]|uniref:hypothetical protein n=1 Tax=Epibacterium sp. MM17-32 TaxID=2917734 RepID=UPI001EF3FAE2|nr:hypothetical protein [Epibacterium sp. MM17-32]MCG7628403.1 hypothetical protein [Epibacterium sp. MM17-32]